MPSAPGLAVLHAVAEPPGLALVAFPPTTAPMHPGVAERALRATPRQLETAQRACQALAAHGAFFLGDGAGTGKSVVLAAVCLHYELSRPDLRRLWLVPNALLRRQVLRELAALSASADVYSYAQLRDAPDLATGRDALLLLDEAHLLRHASGQTRAVERLQATAHGVVYATATPASDVARLGYMRRLGLWGPSTPFADFAAFSGSLARWGPGAAELLALDLKRRGLYSCHRLPEVAVVPLELAAGPAERQLFDACSELWSRSPGLPRTTFFKRLVASLKVRLLAPRLLQDLEQGGAVVLVLQGTGAVAQQAQLTMLQQCLRTAKLSAPPGLPDDAITEVRRALPGPVAELSGRAVALRAAEAEGSRGNAAALSAFQRGVARVLVVTAAGAVGLNVTSPHPIRMYLLELPQTPEVLAQQLGRCNRLNMAHVPQYFNVSLRTACERRGDAVLAKRFSTLGALCCADRSQSLVRSLPWSPLLVRWVTLELVTRVLAARLSGAPGLAGPPRAPQDELRAVLELPRDELLEGPAAEQLQRVLLACPSAQQWLAPLEWTPRTHANFAAPQRAAARVAALCLARRRLPAPLVGAVLAYALGAEWDAEASLASLQPAFLELRKPADFLEAAAAAPLTTQQALMRACEAAAPRCGERAQSVLSVHEHVLRGAARGRYDLAVVASPPVAGRRTLRASVTARVGAQPEPSLYVLATGRLAHLQRTAAGFEFRLPGKARAVNERAYPTLAAAVLGEQVRAHLPTDALGRFRRQEAAELARRRAAAAELSRDLELLVDDPLSRWDDSQRLVLAAEVRGERFVGLLMREAPVPR